MVPKCLARVNIGHMNLHHRHRQDGQGVSNGIAVVRPCARIDNHRVNALAKRLVDAFHHQALVVGLKAFHSRAQFLGKRLQGCVNIRQGGRAVLRGVALAKHVQINAVQHQNSHGSLAFHVGLLGLLPKGGLKGAA